MKTMEDRFTLKEWNALPEGFPAQLLDGQLVREPSPTYGHQDVVGAIFVHLLGQFGRGKVVVSPTDVVIDDFNVLQPDVCVLRETPARESHDVGIPAIVFEVLSPSTVNRDRSVKTAKYLAAGVDEVWIVDPETRTVEVRTTDDACMIHAPHAAGSRALPALEVDLEDLFGAG